MNKLLATVTAPLLTVAIFVSATFAAQAQSIDRYWTVKISKPAPVMITSTINLDFIVFSTVAGDTFEVTLLNNGASTGRFETIVATGKGGSSGRFTINNVPDGTYSYSVLAKNTADGTQQLSDSSSFTVNVPDATVVVASTTTNANANASADTTATTVIADTATTEPVAISRITETSSAESGTDVAGASDNNNFAFAGLALLVLVGATLWYGISKYLDNHET